MTAEVRGLTPDAFERLRAAGDAYGGIWAGEETLADRDAVAAARRLAWSGAVIPGVARDVYGFDVYERLATPDGILDWFQAADRALAARATSFPACVGGQYQVNGWGDYVSERAWDEVFPTEHLGSLYLAMRNLCDEVGPGDLPVEDFCARHADGKWVAAAASRSTESAECPVFYTEAEPEDFEPNDLERLSGPELDELLRERPDLVMASRRTAASVISQATAPSSAGRPADARRRGISR